MKSYPKNRKSSRIPLNERFWKYVNKTNTCWLWTGCVGIKGYGMICDRTTGKTKIKRVHRISWELHFGKIPNNLHVLHKCDIPNCVNPQHLWLGTNRENVDDKVSKNRQQKIQGEDHVNAKLTKKDVLKIRKMNKQGFSHVAISKFFPVNPETIGKIVNYKAWTSVI